MKTLWIIFLTLAACCAALVIILSVSYFTYETPSWADAMGFGSILVFVSVFIIPVCYLPIVHLVQKLRPNVSRFVLIVALAIVGNLPTYIFLWVARNKLGYGENLLFAIGFIVMAVVFGTAYPLNKRALEK